MSATIALVNVSKKFNKGYISDSLRDLLASPVKSVIGRRTKDSTRASNDAFWALKNVSFQVSAGEAFGIIGPNGSGKSTTLKLISRILRPDGGTIEVNGRVGALIELGAGFHPDLTGRENVFLNATILGMRRAEIYSKYESIVDFAGLEDFMETPVKWFSSGMHARLGFSVAIHMEPEVLLIDEVLSVGDLGFQKRCHVRIREFKSNGTTIVFISHNLQAVSSLCDRVALLRKGTIEAIGSPGKIIQQYMDAEEGTKKEGEDRDIVVRTAIFRSEDDERANGAAVFRCGERVIFECCLEFRRDYPDVCLSLQFYTKDLQLLFATNTMRLSGNTFSVREGQRIDWKTRLQMNLAPGKYDAVISVIDRTASERSIVCRVPDLIMQQNVDISGVVFLDPEILELECS